MIHPTSDLILTHAASPIPLDKFRREFLALYEPPLASKATRDKHRQVFDLVEALGATSTDALTPELVRWFISSRPAGQSPHTTRSLLISLRTICNYAEGRRYVVASPFRLRKLSRWIRVPPPAGKRHQSREEIRRVLELMRTDTETKEGWALWRARRLYALTSTVALTALRAGEAQCLWAADIDLDGRIINLVPHGPDLPAEGVHPQFKTEGSAQPIAMPPALVPILRDWLVHRHDRPEGFPMPPLDRIPWLFPGSRRVGAWTNGALGTRPVDRLQAVAGRAGVEDVTFQSLRRSWCTLAEAAGVPQALITRQARHSDTETTKRWYQQRDLEALKEALKGFDF